MLSADIAVPEHEREVGFYASVLGTGAEPLWRPDLMNNLGMPIIGLGERTEEHADLPLQWMPHIQVADVAASVQQAIGLGGKELMHGKKDGQSLWAVLQDLNGATFGIIPVVPSDGSSGEGDSTTAPMGRIAWLDLTVSDTAATRDFYRQVVGWTDDDVEMGDSGESYSDHNMLAGDGRPAAGICHARGVNRDLPPVWLIYLPVGDLAESLRRVDEGGGEVLTSLVGDEGLTTYAVVRDPVGAAFGLVPG